MDINKLKSKIYKRIDKIDDETTLKMVEEVIAYYSSGNTEDTVAALSPSQKKRLKASIQQADLKNLISDDHVKQLAHSWLK